MNTTSQDNETNLVRRSGRVILGLLLALSLSPSTYATSLDLNNYNTLNDVVVAIKNNMPDENSEQYTIPSQQVRDDLNQVVINILNGQDPQTIILPASLQNHYTLAEFVDNGQTYVVLAETVDGDNNGVADRGWATVIINNTLNAKTLSIDIPHPLNDAGTPEQGIAIFKGTQARTFVMSGAHRNANNALAPCFNDPNYKIADAAHNEAHTFHAIVEAIDQYYDSQFQTHTAFQFHGMGEDSSNGLDVYMTHGTKRVPLPNSVIDQIKTDLNISQPTWDVAIPGDPTEADLNGISNLQGRLLNDVHPNAICEIRAYSYTGQFVHIEQISDARDANAYDEWIHALNHINFNIVPPPPGYWITSPNGGETWEIGTQVNITWNTQNSPEDVDIALYKNGSHEKTITNATANDGEYTWVVDGNLTEGADYTVRIKNTTDTDNRDYSDFTFAIIEGNNTPQITVLGPNGGESWDLGAQVLITWSSVNVDGQVKVSLHKNGEFYKTIANTTENDGEITYDVPMDIDPDGDYTVRVRSVDNTSIKDFSDNTFAIDEGNNTPNITVLSPNGGEIWTQNQQAIITWSSNAIPGLVKISLHKNGSYYKNIAVTTENDGEYIWNVPAYVSAGNEYTVSVRSVDDIGIVDFSDATFSVQLAGQALTTIDNYPNPFNPETVIRYQLPNATHVELVVFNMIGQQITQLVNQTQNAGYHAIHFDARHLASGQYIYQIRANNQTTTGRMLLIK
ncbi:MAG: Ser-Thr-rich GPI-anchored membrane family protein [Candidatus Latescibacterota bacterium]